MNDRLLSFLGLCRRAGYLIFGADTVIGAMKDGKALLTLTAGDLSPKSRKEVAFYADKYSVPVCELNRSMDELSIALGRRCGVICITDRGFADRIIELSEQSDDSGRL